MARLSGRSLVGAAGNKVTRTRVFIVGIVIYLVIVSIFEFLHRGFVGPDTFFLFMLLGAIVLGQARTFLRDWIPFVLIFFAWQLLRGYADQAAKEGGFKAHATDIIDAERWLFAGHIPTVELQQALYTPGKIHWYDIATTGIWAFHFVLPLLFAFLLWTRDKGLYWRFVYSLLTVSFAAFFTYILFPAVPPWMAGDLHLVRGSGGPAHVYLIREAVFGHLPIGGGVPSYLLRRSNPDNIAAMPSLHAAYPTLVLLFCLYYWRAAVPVAIAYCLGLWFAVVYIGDHYVVDVLAGIGYGVITFFVVKRVYDFVGARRSSASVSPASEQLAQ